MLSKKSTFAALVALSACAIQGVNAKESAPEQGLPLQRISLFSSGVGYFERGGTINGNQDIQLFFQRDGLNDVLKSMITIDPSGQLRPATYSLPELLARSSSNDLPLSSDQTLGSILRHFQGTQLAITVNDKTIEGLLLSVATKTETDDKGNKTSVDIASVLTDDGLQTVRLDELQNGGKVLLQDAALNKKLTDQLRQNAASIARSVDSSYLPVTLHFAGKGKRAVRTGYIQGTSVWKTSYRLAFNAPEKGAKSTFVHPLLQGWAVVENTSNEDWNNVSLNLIAGTPVSFTMNMSAPLYVRRPEVGVSFGKTLASQVYSESMGADNAKRADRSNISPKAPAPSSEAYRGAAGPQGMAGPSGSVPQSSPIEQENHRLRQDLRDLLTAYKAANISNANRGELFEYAIEQPITLKRGEASMIPIVSQVVEAEKVSIFDTGERDNHAVNGLSLKNTSGLHLAGGPLTIYEDGTYAGDARITDLAPDEERLISYSLDGDLVIAGKNTPNQSYITSMAIKKGVLTISRKERRTSAYEFHNKSNKDKKVLVLTPIRQDYELIKPQKPESKTKNQYRFAVNVPALKNTDFETISERTFSQTVALLNTNLDSILTYSREEKISPQLKAALAEVVKRRNAVDDLRVDREEMEKQITTIETDQKRIRSNMTTVPSGSELYKMSLDKLTKQETQIENLQQQIKAARQKEEAARKDLSEYVQSLNID